MKYLRFLLEISLFFNFSLTYCMHEEKYFDIEIDNSVAVSTIEILKDLKDVSQIYELGIKFQYGKCSFLQDDEKLTRQAALVCFVFILEKIDYENLKYLDKSTIDIYKGCYHNIGTILYKNNNESALDWLNTASSFGSEISTGALERMKANKEINQDFLILTTSPYC